MKGKRTDKTKTKDKTQEKKNNKSRVKSILILLILLIIIIILIYIFRTKKYNINFDTNGGSLINAIKIKKNNTIEKPDDPTKEGYIFAGWYYEDELYDFDEPVKDDMELEAKWQIDESITNIKINKNSLILYPGDTFHLSITTTPNDANTENIVWKSSAPNIIKIDSKGNLKALKTGTATITVSTEDGKYTDTINITVKSKIIKYVVNYKDENGKLLKTESIENKHKISKPTDPTKEGYTFIGWYNGDIPYTFTEEVTKNITLVAKWEKIKYQVTFVNYDGTTLETQSVEYGTVPTYKGNTPTRTGNQQYSYIFTGWTPELTETTKETTYQAVYEEVINEYTVSYKDSDGSTIDEESVKYGSNATKPTDPTKEGYTFKGWYNGDTQYAFTEQVTKNITLVAKWEINKYQVTFVSDGITFATQTIEYKKQATKPTDPTKEGYTFTGWYNGDTPYAFTEEVTENITLVAKWEINKYQVTFVSDGITFATQTIEYKKQATKPTNPTKEGYTFTGWYNENTPYTFAEEVTENITLEAKWEINKYTITFINDGKSLEIQNIEYGTILQKLDDPIKEGHIFRGWYNGDIQYTFTEKVTENITLVAKWEKIKYQVTFVNYDGTTLETQSVEYGTVPTYKGNTPTRTGNQQYSYIFTGWTPKLTETTKETTYQAVYGEVINEYTVSYKDSDGSTIDEESVKYGSNATKPTDPTKEGYTFTGWYNGNTQYTFTEKVTENITLVAKWEINKYQVSFVSDGITIATQTIEYKKQATKPTDPTKEFYIFKGWYNGNAQYTFTEGVTANITLVAKWEKVKYQVTFVNYDGTVLQNSNVEHGATPSYTGATPSKKIEGEPEYVFVGWTPEITVATQSATYTATYKYLVKVDQEVQNSIKNTSSDLFYVENNGNNYNVKFTSYTTTNFWGETVVKKPPHKFTALFFDVVDLFHVISSNENYESFELYYKHEGDTQGKTIDLTNYDLTDKNPLSWYNNGPNDYVGEWIGYLATGTPSTSAAYGADSDDLLGKTITITIKLKEGYANTNGSDTITYYLSFYNA